MNSYKDLIVWKKSVDSLYETETHFIIAQRIGYFSEEILNEVSLSISEIDRMIRALQKSKS